MTFKENLDKSELNEYPVSVFSGEIIMVDNLSKLRKCVERLKSASLLGFDTETKPSFKKGRNNRVALLQLSDHRTAYLFRLNSIGLPGEIAELLADQSIIKAGVAISDDIAGLKKWRRFNDEGFVELQDYVKEFGIESSGLKKLSAIILGFRISKRQQVSNWEAPVLSDAQLSYAATDAWVCYEIYRTLKHKKD